VKTTPPFFTKFGREGTRKKPRYVRVPVVLGGVSIALRRIELYPATSVSPGTTQATLTVCFIRCLFNGKNVVG